MSERRGVFLDRDGTLVELIPYLHKPEEVRLIPGVAASLRSLGEAGWVRIIVTNQSGIARGSFSADDVDAVNARMRELLLAEGADIEGIEFCPHHPDYTGICGCRKPAPGMLQRAAERLNLDPASSWMIGDRIDDALAGLAFGAQTILVRTGYGAEEERVADAGELKRITHIANDLPSACDYILNEA